MAISRTIPSTSLPAGSAGNVGTLADPDWQLDGDVDFRDQESGDPDVSTGSTFDVVDAWGNTVTFRMDVNDHSGSGTGDVAYTAKGITLSGNVGAADRQYHPRANLTDFLTQGPSFSVHDDVLIVADIYDLPIVSKNYIGPTIYGFNADASTAYTGANAWDGGVNSGVGRLQYGGQILATGVVMPPSSDRTAVSIGLRQAGLSYREWLQRGDGTFAPDDLTIANYRTQLPARLGSGDRIGHSQGSNIGVLDNVVRVDVGVLSTIQPGGTFTPSIARLRAYRRRAVLA